MNKTKSNRVVILGTSGVIATNLINELKRLSVKILAIGRKEINLKQKHSYKILSKKIKSLDTIVFISAEAPVKNLKMLSNNLKICSNVVSALESKKIRHLIYISSDAVYSDINKGINEKSETLPTSLHGFMHLARERILKNKFENVLCILRPTLIYGKGDTHNGYGPNRFLNLVRQNKNIKLFGKGEELRDHIYIDTIVKIIIECIIKKTKGVLNLASGKVYSFNYLAKVIIKLSKGKSKILITKRVGKMPHNGFRPFNIKHLKDNFPKVKFGSLKQNLEKYILKN